MLTNTEEAPGQESSGRVMRKNQGKTPHLSKFLHSF